MVYFVILNILIGKTSCENAEIMAFSFLIWGGIMGKGGRNYGLIWGGIMGKGGEIMG